MNNILDGNLVAKKIFDKTSKEVKFLVSKKIQPKLAVILVGDDPASKLYVSIKEKKALELGIQTININLPKDITQKKLIKKINDFNTNALIHGILIQLPLPKHLETETVLGSIDPIKDVDGLHPENLGKLLLDKPFIVPPTPAGIIALLDNYNINLSGKHVVIVGYGKLVGKPLAAMISLSNKLATLTVCNHKTKNLKKYTLQADILISATGVGRLIGSNMVKYGAIVIDAGTAKIDGKIVGDVDFDQVHEKCKYITPPKGGVGPVTVAKLLQNLVQLVRYSPSSSRITSNSNILRTK